MLPRVYVSPRDDDSSTVALRLRQRGGLSSATTRTLRTASRAEPGYPPPPKPRDGGGLTYSVGPRFAAERAELLADGWIAVIRLMPYRVEWRSPDGTWTKGAPLPVPVMPASDREKRAYMQRLADTTS